MAGTSLSLPFSGRLLRLHRERCGLDQQGLADRCKAAGLDISRGQISRYETGENKPKPAKLEVLVAALGIQLDDLLDTVVDERAAS